MGRKLDKVLCYLHTLDDVIFDDVIFDDVIKADVIFDDVIICWRHSMETTHVVPLFGHV